MKTRWTDPGNKTFYQLEDREDVGSWQSREGEREETEGAQGTATCTRWGAAANEGGRRKEERRRRVPEGGEGRGEGCDGQRLGGGGGSRSVELDVPSAKIAASVAGESVA